MRPKSQNFTKTVLEKSKKKKLEINFLEPGAF